MAALLMIAGEPNKRMPRTAQSARQAVGGGNIAAVVFNRHGQSASGFRALNLAADRRRHRLYQFRFAPDVARPSKFSQNSRVPRMINASANGTI